MHVVGGANSAGQGAMFFSRYASQVTMLVRGSSLAKGMSQYLVDQIDSTENIDVLTRTVVNEVFGEARLEAICYQNLDSGETKTVDCAALFAFIGAVPHSELVSGVVKTNRAGLHPDRPRSRPEWSKTKRLETEKGPLFVGNERARHLCGRRRPAECRAAGGIGGWSRCECGELRSSIFEDGLGTRGWGTRRDVGDLLDDQNQNVMIFLARWEIWIGHG